MYMILKDYLAYLNAIIKDNPEALDLEVVCSVDEEGNSHFKVCEYPAVGIYEKGQFCLEGSIEEEGYEKEDINAISVS